MKTKIVTESNPGLPAPCEYTHYCDCVLCREARGEPRGGTCLPLAWGFLLLVVGIVIIFW